MFKYTTEYHTKNDQYIKIKFQKIYTKNYYKLKVYHEQMNNLPDMGAKELRAYILFIQPFQFYPTVNNIKISN